MHNLVPDFILDKFNQRESSGALDAIALFVDVSGFTTITEALMKRGKEGAEILADVMRAIFDPLVQSVYEQGGFVAGFAGDAFTALFPAIPRHSEERSDEEFPESPDINEISRRAADRNDNYKHALAAAAQIQRTMRVTPIRATPFGEFTFAVKLGIADGDAEWGILESANRAAYFFKGAAIDGCAQAEHHAASGDIILTANVYKRVKEFVEVEAQDGFFRVTNVLGELPAPIDLTGFWKPVRSGKNFYPADLLDTTTRGEFRQVVSMFVNLQGNPTRAQLDEFIAPLFRLLAQYDGYLCRLDFGDKGCRLLLFWGAPVSHEHELARALDFILDLRRASPLAIRAGITYDMAFAGFAGASFREEYTCYSSRVNLAARLMSGATWDSIWFDEPTAQRAQKQFDLEAVGAFPFKGFADKQNVFALKGRATATAPLYRFQLVGRAGELARLREWVAPIFANKCAGVMVVIGEAGVGKSRLVHEFQNLPPLSGTGEGWGGGWFLCQTDQILRQSLNPFRYWLRAYFEQATPSRERFDEKLDALITRTMDDALRAELDRARSFLAALVGLTWRDSLYEQLDPKLRRENTFDAIKTLLKAEARLRPIILQIEDLHWLDDDSIDLLRHLTHNLADYPIAILATTREQPTVNLFANDAPQFTLDLGTLSPQDAQSLAEQILARPASPALVEFLLQRTNGNPFFVEQIVLFLRERDLLVEGAAGLDVREQGIVVPTDVREVLTARLDRLAQDVKQVVQTAAVLGREFEVQVLSHMLETFEIFGTVKRAENATVWSALSEIRYIFKHALLRDAAYDMQLRARLRDLHALAGQAIEQVYATNLPPHYADLAFHFGQARDDARERFYARRAGESAAARFANAEAVRYLSRALELTPNDDAIARYELLCAREQVNDLQGARQAQTQDLFDLAALAERHNDDAWRAQVALRRAHYAEATSEYPAAISAAQQALNWANGNAEIHASAHAAWGRVLYRQADYRAAREHLEQARALTRDSRLAAAALLQLGNITYAQSDYLRALEYFDDALRACRDAGNRRGEANALNNRGTAQRDLYDHVGARTSYVESLRLKREIGDRHGECNTLNNLGLLCRLQSDYGDAQTYLEQCQRLCHEIENRESASHALGNLGQLALKQGDYARARTYFERALQLRREIRKRHDECDALILLGLLHHQVGEDETARDYSQHALDLATEIGAHSLRGYASNLLGHAYHGLGDLPRAAAMYARAYHLRLELNDARAAMDARAGMARVALAQGNRAQADAYVQDILRHLERDSVEGTEEPFLVYLTCVQVLRANQDARARQVLDAAHALLQGCAQKIADDSTRQSFLQNVPAHRELMRAWKEFH